MTEAGLSARNPRIRAAVQLQRTEERRRTGLTLLEGPKLVAEARKAGVKFVELFTLEEGEGTLVSRSALERISTTETPQSPVAVIEIPPRPASSGRSAVVAWEISDPGNLGTIIRTAAAFNLDVMTAGRTVDVWAPKVLRAGAGAHFQTGISPLDLTGFKTVATVASGGHPPEEMPAGRLAILVGSESHGLPDDMVAGADHRVTIPMLGGIESLNASIAASIVCYEVAKRNE